MVQEGERYIVTKELESANKWEQDVKATKVKEPPYYGDFVKLKILNTIKVCHILMNNPNIALYL